MLPGALVEPTWGLPGSPGAIFVPKRVPKEGGLGSQNGTKIVAKTMSKTKTKKEALEDRLGRVLGRSWADLGPILGGLGAQNRAVAHTGLVFLKNQLLGKIKLQDASKSDLGTIWVEK